MRYHEISTDLQEAPLADVNTYGDFDSEGSFNKTDRKYMTKAILDGVYKEKLKNLPFDLYLYIINKEGLEDLAINGSEVTGQDVMGEVKWTTEPYLTNDNGNRIPLPFLKDIKLTVLKNLKSNPTSVQLICGNNYTAGGGKITMTPWMIVHRLAHTMDYSKFNLPYKNVVSWRSDKKISWWDVFMMKSLQTDMDNDIEMFMEAAVEYMYTGNIRVNTAFITEKCEKLGLDAGKYLRYIDRELTKYKTMLDGMISKLQGTTRYI